MGTRQCLVAVASRLDKRALAWKCRTPELRRVGAAPHVRLDQLAFAMYKVSAHPPCLFISCAVHRLYALDAGTHGAEVAHTEQACELT